MKLIEYLPDKYGHSPETVAFQEALQPEVVMLWEARDFLLQQLNPRTASGKGLKLWEDAMGVRPAAGDGLDQRRGRVIAKIRGMGVVDAPLLKAVVESFLVGSVEVTERPRDNCVDIQYSTAGLHPVPDPNGIVDAIWEILPAHIGLGVTTEAEPMTSEIYLNANAASGSETELPEWQKEHNFTQTIHLVAAGGAMSVTELPEWREELDFARAVTITGEAGALSTTGLPEWREDLNFTRDINIAGTFGSMSVTELPPAE